jgi:hypothetical protein
MRNAVRRNYFSRCCATATDARDFFAEKSARVADE